MTSTHPLVGGDVFIWNLNREITPQGLHTVMDGSSVGELREYQKANVEEGLVT